MRKPAKARRTIRGQTSNKGKPVTETVPNLPVIGSDLHSALVEFDRGAPLTLRTCWNP
jgi:hypothetical protein